MRQKKPEIQADPPISEARAPYAEAAAAEPVRVVWEQDRAQAMEGDKIFIQSWSSHSDMGTRSCLLRYSVVLFCLCLGLCGPCSGTSSAQMGANGILFGEGKRDTLRDLTGVEVVVESLDVEGLSSARLKAEIESQLDQAGIRVLRDKERLNQPGYPYLYVRLSLLHADPVHTYSLEISLNQTVTLSRYPSISTFAPTWWVHAVGVMSPLDIPLLKTTVHDYLGKFIQAYQAVNPQENR